MEFFHTHISPKAVELALSALRSGWISEGKGVEVFENALADQLGLAGPVALNSGTSALHLALAVAGVGPGDEVVLPAQTFIATGMAVLTQGAVPVFADIDPKTGNLCPVSLQKKMTPKTKAILAVHWAGYPCDMSEIQVIADQRQLPVIEDAAHALGARYQDRLIGTISRFTAFSFQAIKHLTTGDGGLLCCPDKKDREQARRRRWFGIDRENSAPGLLGEREYEVREISFKYHMNDLAAAVGLGNLSDFKQRLQRRQAIAVQYRAAFDGVAGLTLLEAKPDRLHACWLFTMMVERRADFVKKLKAAGIPASVVHQRIDRHPVFGGMDETLLGQAKFDSHQIAIPLHEGLSAQEVKQVIQAVRAGW